MTPDEIAEIFYNATKTYGKVIRKPTLADVWKFDKTVNSLLVEIRRDEDVDDYGLLNLREDPFEYHTITGRVISRLNNLPAYDASIDSKDTDGERKKIRSKMECKIKWCEGSKCCRKRSKESAIIGVRWHMYK